MLEIQLDFELPQGWTIDRIGVPQKGEHVLAVTDGQPRANLIQHVGTNVPMVIISELFDEQLFLKRLGETFKVGWMSHFDGVWYYFPKFGPDVSTPKWIPRQSPYGKEIRAHWSGTKFPISHNHLNMEFPNIGDVPQNYLYTIGDHSGPN